MALFPPWVISAFAASQLQEIRDYVNSQGRIRRNRRTAILRSYSCILVMTNKKAKPQSPEALFRKRIRKLAGASQQGCIAAKKKLEQYSKDQTHQKLVNEELARAKGKAYKASIKKLAMQVISGSAEAERILRAELENPAARQVLENLTEKRKRKNKLLARKGLARRGKFRTARPIYGNAFRPYQGGSPGLGKKS